MRRFRHSFIIAFSAVALLSLVVFATAEAVWATQLLAYSPPLSSSGASSSHAASSTMILTACCLLFLTGNPACALLHVFGIGACLVGQAGWIWSVSQLVCATFLICFNGFRRLIPGVKNELLSYCYASNDAAFVPGVIAANNDARAACQRDYTLGSFLAWCGVLAIALYTAFYAYLLWASTDSPSNSVRPSSSRYASLGHTNHSSPSSDTCSPARPPRVIVAEHGERSSANSSPGRHSYALSSSGSSAGGPPSILVDHKSSHSGRRVTFGPTTLERQIDMV